MQYQPAIKYRRLFLSCWAMTILTLAFSWWKSIQAEADVVLSTRSFCLDAGILGGSAYLRIGPSKGRWDLSWGYSNYRNEEMHPDDEKQYKQGASQFLGEFIYNAGPNPKGGYGVLVCLPFWFLALTVSAFFWALYLFLKRRIRLITRNLPTPSTP